MIDVSNQKCITCNLKQSHFNYPNEEKGLYCASCTWENIVDAKSKTRIKCNVKRPCYNYANETQILYCKSCKLLNMVYIKNDKCIM